MTARDTGHCIRVLIYTYIVPSLLGGGSPRLGSLQLAEESKAHEHQTTGMSDAVIVVDVRHPSSC